MSAVGLGLESSVTARKTSDPVGNVRKWTLLGVAVVTFALLGFTTKPIALLYLCGMVPLTGIEKSFTISDFWHWWVVHLWVEQSFEFFAAAISAYLLMALGLVSRQLAERYDTTLFWQWMRMPGDIVFATGALLMAWDFLVKLRPLVLRSATSTESASGAPEVPEVEAGEAS